MTLTRKDGAVPVAGYNPIRTDSLCVVSACSAALGVYLSGTPSDRRVWVEKYLDRADDALDRLHSWTKT